jgi:hypothetical protein
MGGFASKGKQQPTNGPTGDDGLQLLAERERQLALREEEVRAKQAELERWEGRLRGQEGQEGDHEQPPTGGAGAGGAGEGASGSPYPRSSVIPVLRSAGHSVFAHLGASFAPAAAERYGAVGSVPAARLPTDGKGGQQSLAGQRSLRVFVCSSLQGAHSHALLARSVYARLSNDASRRGLNLSFLDLHDELATSAEAGHSAFPFELNIFDCMLRELENCHLFIGILGDVYGPPLGVKLCEALGKSGHRWIEEEGLVNASMEEVLLRKAMRCQSMVMASCHFHMLRPSADASAAPVALSPMAFEQAACAARARRDEWRAGIAHEWQGRGCLGALEQLVSRYSLTISPDLPSLALAVFAGALCCIRIRARSSFWCSRVGSRRWREASAGGASALCCCSVLLLCADARVAAAEGRSLLDSHFPPERAPGPAAPDVLQGWELGCGAGGGDEGSYQRDLELSRAYQTWCHSSGLELSEPVTQALTAFVLDSEAAGAAAKATGAARYLGAEGAQQEGAQQDSASVLCVLDERAAAPSASVYLALWSLDFEGAQSQVAVQYHRLGVCGEPARPLERELMVVLAALKARFGILQPLPALARVVEELPGWLAMAAARQPLVILLDGLDQLGGAGGRPPGEASEWAWLPAQLPANCKLILGIGDPQVARLTPLTSAEAGPQRLAAAPPAMTYGQLGHARAASTAVGPPSAEQAHHMLHLAAQHAIDAGRWGASGEQHGTDVLVRAALEALPLAAARDAVVLSLLVRNHPRLLVAHDTPGDAAAVAAPSPATSPHRLATMRRASLMDLTADASGQGGVASKGLVCGDVAELMQQVLLHVEAQLASWLPSTDCFWPTVELLATTYMGFTHAALLHHLTKHASHKHPAAAGRHAHHVAVQLLAVLWHLRPYMWCGTSSLHGGHVLHLGLAKCKGVPIFKRTYKSHHQHQGDVHHNHGQHGQEQEEAGAVDLLEPKEAVSEHVYIGASGPAQARLVEYLVDMRAFLSAYHSEFWADYTAAWQRASRADSQVAVKLRMSAQQYNGFEARDGSAVLDQVVGRRVRLVHCLLVVGFLSTQREVTEGRGLLEQVTAAHVEAERADSGLQRPDPGLDLCLALHAAVVEWHTADASFKTHALEEALKAHASQGARTTHGGGVYWREADYIERFVDECRAAAFKVVGRVLHQSSQLARSLQAFEEYLALLSTLERGVGGTELAVAEAQWALAVVKRDLAMHHEAHGHGKQALATLSRHLSAQSRLHVESKALVEQLERRLTRKLAPALPDSAADDASSLMDLNAADVEADGQVASRS